MRACFSADFRQRIERMKTVASKNLYVWVPKPLMDKLTLRDNDATANAIIFHQLFDLMLEQRAQGNTLISIEMLRNE